MAYVGNPIDVIKKLYTDKQWDKIVLFCQNMLKADPKDMIALQNIAMASLNLGRLDQAISFCDKVLEINEFDEYATKNKILALEKLGKFDSVIEMCNKMLTQSPFNPWILNTKGLAYNEMQKHDSAIQYYDMALRIEPDNVTALLNKANTLLFLGKFADAIPLFDKAQQREKSSFAANAKSQAYRKLGKEDEAFLAAQGVLISDIERYVEDAQEKKMKIFDYYCMIEYELMEKAKNQPKTEFKVELE